MHAALLLADMDCSLDSLSWEYLFTLLRRLNIGPRFLSYLTLLYPDITPRCGSRVLHRQYSPLARAPDGCPLSPYLFALAMEPLAAWVRMDAQVAGLEWAEGNSDRIALYADNVLFFLTDIDRTGRTGPRLMRIMQVFGETSGLYMNPQKSTLWILGLGDGPGAWASSVQVVYDGVKYLGWCCQIRRPYRGTGIWCQCGLGCGMISRPGPICPCPFTADRPSLRWSPFHVYSIIYRITHFPELVS